VGWKKERGSKIGKREKEYYVEVQEKTENAGERVQSKVNAAKGKIIKERKIAREQNNNLIAIATIKI
jgi:hypothetical protein